MRNEHFDVMLIGAGLSGIGAAYRIQTHCPDRTYLILEARERLGWSHSDEIRWVQSLEILQPKLRGSGVGG